MYSIAAIMALLTYQPIKGFWTLFALALNTARLPFWLIYYVPSFLRPNPKWSYKQAVLVQVIRNFLWNAAMVSLPATIGHARSL